MKKVKLTHPNSTLYLFGGYWFSVVDSGSRALGWNFPPSVTASNFSVRGTCDHWRVK